MLHLYLQANRARQVFTSWLLLLINHHMVWQLLQVILWEPIGWCVSSDIVRIIIAKLCNTNLLNILTSVRKIMRAPKGRNFTISIIFCFSWTRHTIYIKHAMKWISIQVKRSLSLEWAIARTPLARTLQCVPSMKRIITIIWTLSLAEDTALVLLGA